MAKKILAVIGMHRSGTSLVAQWLAKSGLDLGENLLGEGLGNIHGHYEDLEFVRTHSDIMIDWGLDPNGVESLKKNYQLTDKHQSDLFEMLERVERAGDWGWKDPRTCLFLDFYSRYMRHLDFLVVYRDPVLVVDSLLRRKLQMKKQQQAKRGSVHWYLKRPVVTAITQCKLASEYWRAWNDYNELILNFVKHTSSGRVFVCSLDELIDNPVMLDDWLLNRGFELDLAEVSSIFDRRLLANKASLPTFLVSSLERERSSNILAKYGELLSI